MLTQERLKELLHYDESTGIFTWRVAPNGRVRVGDVAGTERKDGHIVIAVDGRRKKAHRLAWLYVHGCLPPSDIDHADRHRPNNRISNLRLATRSQIKMNMGLSAINTSGFKGVSWDKAERKWRSSARINGRLRFLGHFSTPEAASEAYQAFARQHHGEFYLPQEVAK